MKEITFSDIGTITGDYKILGVSLTLILIALCIFFCWRRAGSLHFFLDRIWLLVGGTKEFHDKKLNEMWEGVRDVELFRYRSGFPNIYSKEKIRLISEWLVRNKIELSELIRVTSYFDVKNVCLQKINYIRRENIAWAAAIIFGVALSFGIVFTSENRVLFYVVKTDKYFSYSGKSIYIYGENISNDVCKKDYPEIDGMDDLRLKDQPRFDKIVACKIFEKDKNFYEDNIKMQRIFFAIISAILMIMTIIVLKWIRMYRIAEDIYFRIYKKKSNQK